MYVLNTTKVIKKMSINEIEDFRFVNYHKRIGISKENSYRSMKSMKTKFLLLLVNKLI